VVGLAIVALTVGLVARRYSKAPTIELPKEGIDEAVLADQIYNSEEIVNNSYKIRTGSLCSAASYIDIQSFTDTAVYSYTEGET